MSGESAIAGGKASGLRALARAGLPVPTWTTLPAQAMPSYVRAVGVPSGPPSASDRALLQRAIAEMRARPVADLADVLPGEPGPFAVRSSASVEDRAGTAAAGLFDSVLNVARADLADAVRTVWASALTPAVWTYLAARGQSFEDVQIAVIVQVQIAAAETGTTYTRHPTDPDAMLVESTQGWRVVTPDDDASDDVATLSRAAARAIECDDADVEWVRDAQGALWLVQARPVPPQPARATPPADAFAFTRGDSATWHWDVTHNPEPLSPAQIGLVHRVGGETLRVVHGYLYARARPPRPCTAGALDETPLRDMTAALDAAEARGATLTAADAVDTYATVYAAYVALSGPLAAARRELPDLLATAMPAADATRTAHALLGGESAARLESVIDRVARGRESRATLDAIAGPMAPAWDVAVPTYRETPTLLDDAVAAARLRPAHALPSPDLENLPANLRAALPEVIARARRAADIAELDDRCFARAQALVRGALARMGDDAFWVPLDDAIAGRVDPDRAAAHRAAWREQRALTMPMAVRDGHPLPYRDLPAADHWIGRGSGGQVQGTVVRLDGFGTETDVADGAIAVAQTLTPAMAVLVSRAGALVIAHGGLLDHGASIARELGIPCVVGCHGAFEQLRSGDRVWVDGAAGFVIRVG